MRMKKVFGLLAATSLLLMAAGPAGMNARFLRWQERSNVIHILVFNDEGRPGQPAAQVEDGQWILFGYELGDVSVEVLETDYLDNPLHDITLSIDGATAFSVKTGYQEAFEAATRSGPRWSWDHDGDGAGDRDGDGIGDWSGPTLFWRYQHPGLAPGTHTFDFTYIDIDGAPLPTETITVEVLP